MDKHEPVAYEFIPNGELLYPHELERQPDADYVPLYAAPPKREWEPRALDEMAEANKNLAPWLSAALEDDNACDEFKSAVRWWFSSGSYDMQSMTRRVWQGLTDEEIFDVIRSLCADNETAEMLIDISMDEYRAIESKLKEKNT